MARDLKLGLNTGYWSAGPPPGVEDAVAEADRLGFDSIWTAEAYGSDVLTPLAWWGSKTENVRLGTAIMQMSARQPAAAAMAAMTMDHLSGGRFILGVGVSGPQVVEGWYGRPFEKPLARTREYVQIIRDIVARKDRSRTTARTTRCPTRTGPGSASRCKSTIHPVRDDIPIFLGAEGPKNVALAAEICDGWLALFFSPRNQDFYRDALAEGFAPRGRAALVGRLRDRRDGAGDHPRRRRAGRRLPAPDVRALLRRHGRAQRELPPRRRGPARLRGARRRRSRTSTSTARRTRPRRRSRPRWSRTSR